MKFLSTLASLTILVIMFSVLSAAAEDPNNPYGGAAGGGHAAAAATPLTEEQRQGYIQRFIDEYGHQWAVAYRLDQLDSEAAVVQNADHAFIEHWAEQGNQRALATKTIGLWSGTYGYQQNRDAARHFIEARVAQGDPAAISFEARALSRGQFWHRRNPAAARAFIDQ